MFDRLREDLNSIRERDPAARSSWEVLTCYPGVHMLLFHRLAHGLWKRRFYWFGRFISQMGRFFTGIEIHPGAVIGRRVFIDHGTGVVIGETAEVGDDCTIYQGVTLGGTSLYRGTKRHPTLGKGVVVGAGAQVLGGFTVGDGARIGSNAVVLHPVPAGATAVGNPAHILDRESPEKAPERTEEKQKESATVEQRIFSAYGVTRDMSDPLASVMHELIDHAVQADQRFVYLLQCLDKAGVKIEEIQCDELDKARLSKLVD